MASEHGGDLYDLGQMTDEEIRALVVQHLREYPNLDADWIEVRVQDGLVTLSGRVGTDAEIQVAEQVVQDVIGIESFASELVVDELHRGENPEAADDAAVAAEENDTELGSPAHDQSDTAEHLSEDLERETFGTHDPVESVQDGVPYTPPERPVGDGYTSREDH